MTDSANELPEDFALLVRDALAHLYDFAHLERHPLGRLAGTAEPFQDTGKALRALLLDTLEQLNPGDSVSRNDKEWRPYGILVRRYVDGYEIEQIMRELGISLRQFQRDHRKGLLAVASILWRRRQPASQASAAGPDGLKQEVDRLGLALESVDLGELVASIVAPAQALAQGRQVELVVKPPRRALLARADAMLAKQALLGTLSALITAQPGRIDVSWRAAAGRARLELSVQPPLAADGSFDVRLAAAAELVQAQGGQLEAIPSPHGIRAVHLSFRLAQGTRALLIDDNESVLQLFERYLAAEGYLVTGVSGAAGALEAIEQERPEVIVLDVMMRNVDGWQLLQRLRANPDLEDVPIVVCSVLNERELAYALGARSYLKKPVSQQELLAALRQALDESNRVAPHRGAS